MLVCLICLQVHRFIIKEIFQVSTPFREGLHHLSFTHLFWIWTIQTTGTPSIHRRCNIPDKKSGDSTGEQCKYQLIWSSSVLELLSKSRLHLQLSSVRYAIWLSEFWFETFISRLFWLFMLFFTLNLSFFTLMWYFSNLIYHSPLCFGYIQGTALMLLARSGATTWNLLAACGAIT